MISKSDFLNCYYDINPTGDAEQGLESMNIILERGGTTMDGKDITFEFICNQYKKYCDMWEAKWEGTEDRYIPSKERKLAPLEFIINGKYKEKFEYKQTNRDYYLFGGIKIIQLSVQLKIFKDELKHKKQGLFSRLWKASTTSD